MNKKKKISQQNVLFHKWDTNSNKTPTSREADMKAFLKKNESYRSISL